MTDDIVARLRKWRFMHEWIVLPHEAADEIERLRSALRIYACDCPPRICLAVDTACGIDARIALEGENKSE